MNVNAKQKLSKAKNYMADHHEEIIMGVVITGLVSAYVAVTVVLYKEIEAEERAYEQNRKEMNDWMNDLRAAGTAVYRLADDRYLTVDKNGIQQTHLV